MKTWRELTPDAQHEALMHPLALQAQVSSVRDDPSFVQCPRCRRYHTVRLNYDGLCDACCHSIKDGWPDHVSVPFINAAWESQRRHFSERNSA